MHISVSDAKARLTDLVRRAEAGEDITLTRRGAPTVRLVPVDRTTGGDDRWALLEALQGVAQGKPGWEGVTAATAADFLYDDKGLPA